MELKIPAPDAVAAEMIREEMAAKNSKTTKGENIWMTVKRLVEFVRLG